MQEQFLSYFFCLGWSRLRAVRMGTGCGCLQKFRPVPGLGSLTHSSPWGPDGTGCDSLAGDKIACPTRQGKESQARSHDVRLSAASAAATETTAAGEATAETASASETATGAHSTPTDAISVRRDSGRVGSSNAWGVA
jgi:hypothetical protein